MEPRAFIRKWRNAKLKERSAAQEHFIDLCRLLDEPTPAEADPTGEHYCFERGTRSDAGTAGWADVWKRHHFAWEYKGPGRNLDAAFAQLRQYAPALENPPLLIASDLRQILIRTNWTNSVSKVYTIDIEDIQTSSTRDILKWAFTDPKRLQPGQTRRALTERAATSLASVAHALRKDGHDPQEVAQFLNRIIFCIFAEDIGLLPSNLMSRMLAEARVHPEKFTDFSSQLFGTMSTGGWVGFEKVEWFDGGLFSDDNVLPLNIDQVDLLCDIAGLNWSDIDPSILGTLFERGLDPNKRSQLGAHYTDSDKIMSLVDPVIIQPWLADWCEVKVEIKNRLDASRAAKTSRTRNRQLDGAKHLMNAFLDRLRAFIILDPACGSGNFLYLGLQALKDLEHRIQLEAESLGLPRSFPSIGPQNLKGIEINPFAAELARIAIWIGEIQWMRRNGFSESRDPILKPIVTIECRDALISDSGSEAVWPDADVVIGNPPFLGYSPMRGALGDAYVDRLREVFKHSVPAFADLVCYWFHKAGALVADGRVARAGLVATNSIRGGKNRSVLDHIVQRSKIFHAWSDEPWVVDGASVRVSLICFTDSSVSLPVSLDGDMTTRINADLTSGRVDLTSAKSLSQNRAIAFVGGIKKGKFDVPGSVARDWMRLPKNPNGRPNSDVLKPWINGRDLTQRPQDTWVIDFGHETWEHEAAYYEAPFAHVKEHVQPVRNRNKRKELRKLWWRHDRTGQTLFKKLDGLKRFIATPTLSKHRIFAWFDARVCPDHQLTVIAREDDLIFGILHSRFHEIWSLRLGTSLEDRPRYTPTTTFEKFPFPQGLSPDVPVSDFAEEPRAQAIAEAARELVAARDRWLHPPEWVEWVSEAESGYPERPVPRSREAAKQLECRTLTNLYNSRPQWLDSLHRQLDEAVALAYGWDPRINSDSVLEELLDLNQRLSANDSRHA